MAHQAQPSAQTSAQGAIPFKIVYQGKGTWSRLASLKTSVCSLSESSSEQSHFNWKITWPRVLVVPGHGHARIVGHAVGALKIGYDQRSSEQDSCQPPAQPTCQDTGLAAAPESKWGYLSGAQNRRLYRFTLDADASPNNPSQCPSYAPDEGFHQLIYVDNYGPRRDAAKISPLQATIGVSSSELSRFSKHVFNVKKGPFNPPPANYDCGTPPQNSPGYSRNCSENQDWSGNVTIQRLRR